METAKTKNYNRLAFQVCQNGNVGEYRGGGKVKNKNTLTRINSKSKFITQHPSPCPSGRRARGRGVGLPAGPPAARHGKAGGRGFGLYLLFIVSCILVIAQGCGQVSPSGLGGGGGSSSSEIVGSWTGTHGGSADNFVFTSDGKYTWNITTAGTWTMNGDLLYLDGRTTPFKVVISGNTMNWYEKDPDGNLLTTPSRTFTKA